ncbi:MAG: formate--tetrahydrofolate ligase, partial [Deltaproteobacteria bacterium]|nr:formate--tetrahydrofolate ligase [Deltaproteobacteria bacterium]
VSAVLGQLAAGRTPAQIVDDYPYLTPDFTESGFAADIGFEKFWNLKCRFSNLVPNAAVIVATVRALKCHGGAPIPAPGKPLPEEYKVPNVGQVEKGCENLLHHVNVVKKSGISPVVCINSFVTDTPDEIKAIRDACVAAGARVATSDHWLKGGEGAIELAEAVKDACQDKPNFKFLYDLSQPLKDRVEIIAKEVYGADGVDYNPDALKKLEGFQKDPATANLGLCMVKTHLSLSDNPTIKGVPKGWKLFVRDVLIYAGAGFVVPVAGAITLMPGTASDPAYRRVDVDTETGKVKGLF